MDQENRYYCAQLDRWFDSQHEMIEAVFKLIEFPSQAEENRMIRAANISAGRKGKQYPKLSESAKQRWQESGGAIYGVHTPEAIEKREATRAQKRAEALARGEEYGGGKNKGTNLTSEAIKKREATRTQKRAEALARGESYGTNITSEAIKKQKATRAQKRAEALARGESYGVNVTPETIAQGKATKAQKQAEALARGESYGHKGKKMSPETIAQREATKARNREAKKAAQALTNPNIVP